MAKQLQVLMNLGNNDKLFESFNWIMGVVQDHNIISGVMRDHVAGYYVQKLHSAVQWSTELFQKAFNKIRRSPPHTEYRLCYLNISSCPNTKLDRFYVTIYNPLGWPVTMPVRLPIRNIKYEVFDPSGTKVKAVKMSIPDHVFDIPNRPIPATSELVFIAQNLPALGLRSYFIETPRLKRVKKSPMKKIDKKQQKYIIRPVPKEYGKYLENNYNQFYSDQVYTTTKYIGEKTTTNKGALTFKSYDDLENTTNKNELTVKSIEDIATINNNALNNKQPPNNSININNFDSENKSHEETFDKSDVTTQKYIEATSETNLESKENTSSSTEKTSTTTQEAETLSILDELNLMKPYGGTPDPKITVIPKEEAIVSDINDEYYSRESNDTFIRNQYIQINLDEYRKIASMNMSNSVSSPLEIQYYCYISDEPATGSSKRQPGGYVFRSADVYPEPILDFIEVKVYKSDIVEEIHTRYSKYASFAVKLYKDNPIIEIDWIIGPVPAEDDFGREVFIRYTTDLENEGAFYTDANGRQMVKRIRHKRPMYEPYNLDPIAGNFYPVTSRIYIEDTKKNLRFSVFNDRSEGGSSLLEGSIDLMVHRRILTDDTKAFIFINETESGKGLIVRGNHYLYLTKADYKHNRVYEKRFAKEIELKPQIMFNRIKQDTPKHIWKDFHNEFTAINKKLPIGVHILTIQEWNEKTLLLRLENYLEKVDTVKSGIKKINLNDLFVNVKTLGLTEMNLSGNVLSKDAIKLSWRANGSFVRNFNQFYGSSDNIEYITQETNLVDEASLDKPITLVPQQIRTFILKYEYIDNKVHKNKILD